MRASHYVSHESEDGESVFVTMTDMTISVLFIVMILLAFFASQYRETEFVSQSEYDKVIAELDALKLELEKSWAETAAANRRANALAAELTKANDQIRQFEDLVTSLDARIHTLLAQIRDLKTQLTRSRVETTTANQRADALAAGLVEAKSEIQRLNEIITALKVTGRDPLEIYLAQVAEERNRLLLKLSNAVKKEFPDLKITVSEQDGALRFQGEGLFAWGQSRILKNRQKLVSRLAEELDRLLPCHTFGPRSAFRPDCNPAFAIVEAVQIEGHTDSDGAESGNMTLSANRAVATWQAMVNQATGLNDHQNLMGQPVLSVAGYGESRPVASNATKEGKDANRRIDLRFIMMTPTSYKSVKGIRQRLVHSELDPNP